MLIDEALDYLDLHINRRLTLEKIDQLSLGEMELLLEVIGNPQQDFPTIHITGTNGKGSTAAMITELLSALGLTVGTYTSPHVSSITERILINGEPIHEEEFAENVGVLSLVESHLDFSPSWFELVTAVAFRSFADAAVDVAVIEVGMLGRFDATNVSHPAVSVITNIGYDHTDGEEGWRRKLAWEKAGIIRNNGILCLGETDEDLEDIFINENPKEILRRNIDFSADVNELAIDGRHLNLRTPNGLYEDIFLPLHGEHQGSNAAIALAAAEAFVETSLPLDVVQAGFQNVRLFGRFEVVASNPLIILDGAHNPPGAEAAAKTLRKSFSVDGKLILILGMTKEKNTGWMLDCLEAEKADLIICTEAASPRAMPSSELALEAEKICSDVRIEVQPKEALESALVYAGIGDLILATGSLYVVGAIRDAYMSLR
ncbi:MAG: dihydrofolate synthase [Acidimicrobiaceae bacterium]|nr:dihydrofolate synthase [Acidimicrobiaceae bacterium]